MWIALTIVARAVNPGSVKVGVAPIVNENHALLSAPIGEPMMVRTCQKYVVPTTNAKPGCHDVARPTDVQVPMNGLPTQVSVTVLMHTEYDVAPDADVHVKAGFGPTVAPAVGAVLEKSADAGETLKLHHVPPSASVVTDVTARTCQ